jgi:maltose O-acetyltransferase
VTLKEQLRSGEMYNDYSEACSAARHKASKLTKLYNNSDDKQERKEILDKLLEKCGEDVHFANDFRCEFGFNITIGNHFFANYDCVILDCAEVMIGNDVLFGPRVGIYCANHATDAVERRNGGCYAKPVTIGDDVWIGAGVHINPGVSIGSNSIIGSGSVVTKNIPANVIAAGNPCRVIRAITEADKTGFMDA